MLIVGGINHYTAGQNTVFNFADWDTFAKTSSYNTNAKVYLGVPAAQSAAGTGYVDIDTLGSAAQYLQKTYSSFGGIMMWYVHSLTHLTLGIVHKHGRTPSVVVSITLKRQRCISQVELKSWCQQRQRNRLQRHWHPRRDR
jgi:hypothetical protein